MKSWVEPGFPFYVLYSRNNYNADDSANNTNALLQSKFFIKPTSIVPKLPHKKESFTRSKAVISQTHALPYCVEQLIKLWSLQVNCFVKWISSPLQSSCNDLLSFWISKGIWIVVHWKRGIYCMHIAHQTKCVWINDFHRKQHWEVNSWIHVTDMYKSMHGSAICTMDQTWHFYTLRNFSHILETPLPWHATIYKNVTFGPSYICEII